MMPHKYRKKPVEIEAAQIDIFNKDKLDRIAAWCGGEVKGEELFSGGTLVNGGFVVWLEITTLEGIMRADHEDWVIKGVKGEFYPCKPDIFEATYEEVLISHDGMRTVQR